MSNTPAFLNKFPAQAVPTPQGDPGPGFIHNAPIDPGNPPEPVAPPTDLPGPIHMQAGWHQGPGVSVSGQAPATYGVPEGHQEQSSYSLDDIASEQARLAAEQRAWEMVSEAEAAAQAAKLAADAASEKVQKAAPGLFPRMAGYAAIAALGYSAGRKFAPHMPIKAIRGSVPVAGALTGAGVAAAFYKDYDGGLMRGAALLAAMIGGVYVADVLYSKVLK